MVGSSQRPTVAVLFRGNQHVRDVFFSTADGGRKLTSGVVEQVADMGVRLEAVVEPCSGIASFRQALEGGVERGDTAVFGLEPGVVVISLESDLTGAATPDWGQFGANLSEVVQRLKGLGIHVLVLTASTVAPGEVVSGFAGRQTEPQVLRAHRANLAALEQSHLEGISIIDADRIVAELGGDRHVTGFLDYSVTVCEHLRDELIAVLADYGFLDDRAIMPQTGRNSAAS